jgi:1,4-dihydroxy-6-naphthoate synthase
MTITIGFSPCPNDTFIFDALINGRIDTGDLRFEPVFADVQTLNEWALQGKLDVTKISYGVLPLLVQHYQVLESGGALGRGVGPLLISKAPLSKQQVNDGLIGIPGTNTTAHMLFSLAYPDAKNKKFLVFSDLENAVLERRVDAAVIIHENRFTFQQKGLVKIVDLGEYWEEHTGNPIPLGGIVVRKNYPDEVKSRLNDLIMASVQYSLERYPQITDYIKDNAQEMDESVMRQHIDLYVNDYSVALGEQGKSAVDKLLSVYEEVNGQKIPTRNVFA